MTPPRAPTSHPVPGHEVFGFVPYWEMNGDIAQHLAKTPLTTLALFSVTHTKDGAIDTKQTGYKRITGSIGAQLIREAHARGTAVQLVYSSLGQATQRAAVRLAERPGQDDRGARRPRRRRSGSTASTSTSSSSATTWCPPTARSSAGCATRCAPPCPTAASRSRRAPG